MSKQASDDSGGGGGNTNNSGNQINIQWTPRFNKVVVIDFFLHALGVVLKRYGLAGKFSLKNLVRVGASAAIAHAWLGPVTKQYIKQKFDLSEDQAHILAKLIAIFALELVSLLITTYFHFGDAFMRSLLNAIVVEVLVVVHFYIQQYMAKSTNQNQNQNQ